MSLLSEVLKEDSTSTRWDEYKFRAKVFAESVCAREIEKIKGRVRDRDYSYDHLRQKKVIKGAFPPILCYQSSDGKVFSWTAGGPHHQYEAENTPRERAYVVQTREEAEYLAGRIFAMMEKEGCRCSFYQSSKSKKSGFGNALSVLLSATVTTYRYEIEYTFSWK